MPKKKLRLIIDTNLWISFLITRKLSVIAKLFDLDAVVFVFSQELIEEFLEVASRKRFSKYFDKEDVSVFLDTLSNFSEMFLVKSLVSVCRDNKDNFLLALAKDSKAEYLLTGDEDLLIIRKFHNTEILSYSEFAARY